MDLMGGGNRSFSAQQRYGVEAAGSNNTIGRGTLIAASCSVLSDSDISDMLHGLSMSEDNLVAPYIFMLEAEAYSDNWNRPGVLSSMPIKFMISFHNLDCRASSISACQDT